MNTLADLRNYVSTTLAEKLRCEGALPKNPDDYAWACEKYENAKNLLAYTLGIDPKTDKRTMLALIVLSYVKGKQ